MPNFWLGFVQFSAWQTRLQKNEPFETNLLEQGVPGRAPGARRCPGWGGASRFCGAAGTGAAPGTEVGFLGLPGEDVVV